MLKSARYDAYIPLNDSIRYCEYLIDKIETQDAALETARGQTVQDFVSLIVAKSMYKEHQNFSDEMEKKNKRSKNMHKGR